MDSTFILDIIKKELKNNDYSVDAIDEAFRTIKIHVTNGGDPPPPPPPPGLPECIKMWCAEKNNQGLINYYPDPKNNTYIRFTLDCMDKYIPEQLGRKSGWNNGHFYFCEIEVRDTVFYIKFEINNNNTPENIKDVYKILDNIYGYPRKIDWQWRQLYSTRKEKVNGEIIKDNVFWKMDMIFADFNKEMEKCAEYLSSYIR